ncbi:hypothetical protein [Streptomyces sp. NPDC026589]|uniref:hypothetical protein n=1 Tax=Streptomyces sp. NPDC026589 TaxID=3155609 RepID=UPI0033E64232
MFGLGNTFHARLLVPGPPFDGGVLTGFTGRLTAGKDLLVTVVDGAAFTPAEGGPSGEGRPTP